jgi:probable HAF family extracellular repeat protein
VRASNRRPLAAWLVAGLLTAGCGSAGPSVAPSSGEPPSSTAPMPAVTPAVTPAGTATLPPLDCPQPPTDVDDTGETLDDIAAAHRVTVEALLAANPSLSGRDPLEVGLQIVISPMDLGARGGQGLEARDVNDAGLIAGSTTAGRTHYAHAVVWQDGVMTDLGTLGGELSGAVAVNDRGQVVGSSDTTAGESHAFLWQDGVMTDIGAFAPADINNLGQVVGTTTVTASDGSRARGHAVLWQDGALTDLGTLGEASWATAVNDLGQVIGSSAIEPGRHGRYHAFLWQDGAMTDLTPGFEGFSEAFDVNDRGQVAGSTRCCWDAAPRRPTIWHDGVATVLADPGADAEARAVDERGRVVGVSWSEPLPRAVLWQDGTQTALGALAGTDIRTWAEAMNECGQVVGRGWTEAGANALLWYVPANRRSVP